MKKQIINPNFNNNRFSMLSSDESDYDEKNNQLDQKVLLKVLRPHQFT